MRVAAILLSHACAGDPGADARAYARALERVQKEPRDAPAACALGDPALAADCTTAAAEALAAHEPAAALALCEGMEPGSLQDECAFQVAERSQRPDLCARAGGFADDCRMHVWSHALGTLVPAAARPGDVEDALGRALPDYGLDPMDPRPWSAAYRWVLGAERPLDRASCDRAPRPALVEACRATALALYDDRLNRARDTGRFPCDGTALPPELEHAPDPDLDARIAQRRARELCPPAAP